MGRRIRDSRLEKREDRRRLKARADREPYWRGVREGLHLGYRVGARGGVWIARYRTDDGYAKRTLGLADDVEDADGVDVLTYDQATDKARELLAPAAPPSPTTVREASKAYLEWFEANRKSVASTKASIDAHILPTLGDKRLDELTRAELKAWLQKIVRAPARKRTSKGKPTEYRGAPKTEDELRARRASANRVLNILKALLNYAVEHELVQTAGPWRELRGFKGADEPRVRFLTGAEATRLANSAAPDFRKLVRGALFTGARFGELAALTVSDVDAKAGKVYIAPSKSGRSRHVPLSDPGAAFFEEITAGREASKPVFERSSGTPWGKNHHVRALLEACKKAKIEPAVTFHELRHTYASALINAGVELPVVAKLLGHADTRITIRHYAHLADETLAAAVKKLPAFGQRRDRKVQAIA